MAFIKDGTFADGDNVELVLLSLLDGVVVAAAVAAARFPVLLRVMELRPFEPRLLLSMIILSWRTNTP